MKLTHPASARINRRYLLLATADSKHVEQAILDYIGILGWAKAAPLFVSTQKKQSILAIDRKALVLVRAACELCSPAIQIVRVSGTLKGLNRNL